MGPGRDRIPQQREQPALAAGSAAPVVLGRVRESTTTSQRWTGTLCVTRMGLYSYNNNLCGERNSCGSRWHHLKDQAVEKRKIQDLFN